MKVLLQKLCQGSIHFPQPVFNPVTFKLLLIFFLLRLSTLLTLPASYSSVVLHVIQEVIQNLFHWLWWIPECFTDSCSFSSQSVYSWNIWGSVNDWQTWLAGISSIIARKKWLNGDSLKVCSSLFCDMFCFLPQLLNRVELDNEYLGKKDLFCVKRIWNW